MFSAATKSAHTAATAANYIEDVFSTYLYTGNGSTQTINNGIDLAGKGGLTWIKARSLNSNNALFDTTRGVNNYLFSDLTSGQVNYGSSYGLTNFSSTGFTVADPGGYAVDESGITYASWTFRKQPKFFDVVTYTGTGATQNISHSLGSVPGFIITKNLASGSWWCYHTSLGNATAVRLNSTAASNSDSTIWNSTTPTSTQFTVGASASSNNSGATYVAYLFSHNAGGFGLSGTDNVISCGSFLDTDASVNLGYEPQYILYKNASSAGNWTVIDNMRGMPVYSSGATEAQLFPNTSGAETNGYGPYPTATGFNILGVSSGTYIYMAIRRPMKVPTDATTVFNVVARNGTGAAASVTSGFAVDLIIGQKLSSPAYSGVVDRLRGFSPQLSTQQTVAEVTDTTAVTAMGNTTVSFGDDSYNWGAFNQAYASPAKYAPWMFARRPGFFDEVCYTGTGSNLTVNHNLGVAPALMITKKRNGTFGWFTYCSLFSSPQSNYVSLQSTAAVSTYSNIWGSSAPTSTTFSLDTALSDSGSTYVAYLFATCPGVSKVGSYTGTGSTQTINCGFTGGARFVLIKRTDSTGDWYVWDTARGMVAGTDPSLALNTTAAEINANSVYTATTGFSLLASPSADVNTSGGSYIFLAIA